MGENIANDMTKGLIFIVILFYYLLIIYLLLINIKIT